jgi:ketosteroid isomerase-like protein
MTPIETVQQMYADFGRGDVPAILARLAADVDWEYGVFPNPVPWLQPLRGRDKVAGFFQSLGALDFKRFEPKEIYGDAKTVVALIDVEFVIKSSGKRVFQEDEVHIWRFDAQGRVARFAHRIDTHQHVQAIRAD